MKTSKLLKELEQLIKNSFTTFNPNRDAQVLLIIKQLEENGK